MIKKEAETDILFIRPYRKRMSFVRHMLHNDQKAMGSKHPKQHEL